MEANEARVNVTYNGANGDLPDPMSYQASNGDIFQMVAEALHTGYIPGIPADPEADLTDFVVDRFPATDATPYNRLMIRPKTPFGG